MHMISCGQILGVITGTAALTGGTIAAAGERQRALPFAIGLAAVIGGSIAVTLLLSLTHHHRHRLDAMADDIGGIRADTHSTARHHRRLWEAVHELATAEAVEPTAGHHRVRRIH